MSLWNSWCEDSYRQRGVYTVELICHIMRADGRGKDTCIFMKCTYIKNPEQKKHVRTMPMMGRSEGKCGKVNNEKKKENSSARQGQDGKWKKRTWWYHKRGKERKSKRPSDPRECPYMTTHFNFDFPSLLAGAAAPGFMLWVCRKERMRFMKRRSTFSAVLADVSMNPHPNWCANAAPSSFDTSRSYALSHLLPTSMKIGSPRLTRRIDWRKISRRANVVLEAIEYTSMKPWPSLEKVGCISGPRAY